MNNPADTFAHAAAAGALMTIFMMVFVITLIASCWFFWVFAIVRCLTKCPKDERVTWLLVIIFVPLFGFLLYFIIGPKTRGMPPANTPPYVPTAPAPPTIDDTARAVARSIQDGANNPR